MSAGPRWSMRAILLAALVYPTILTWIYFSGGAGHDAVAVKLLYAGGKLIQFALPVVAWLWFDRARMRPSPIRRDGLLAGASFGLVVAAGIIATYFLWLRRHPALTTLRDQAHEKAATFGLQSPATFIAFAVFLSAIHALLEEYYWRAFVFSGLRDWLPMPWALVVSSLGFMAHHVLVLQVYFPGRFWSLTMPFALAIAAGGGVWAWLYQRSSALYAGWISHALVDASLMLIGYDLLFRVPLEG